MYNYIGEYILNSKHKKENMAYHHSKWNKIYREQMSRLQAGEFAADTRLPSLLELAREWSVSYLTAQKIVRKLTDAGYLRIVHGRGIFVNAPTVSGNKPENSNLRIGFLGYTTGEVFADIYRGVQSNLPESCQTVLLSTPEDYINQNTRESEEMFQNIIRRDIDSLVVTGDYNINYRTMKNLQDKFKQIIFSFYFCGKNDIANANIVTFDYYRGGYLAARHLLEQGFNNIAYLTYEDISQFKMLQRDVARMPSHDLLAGIIAACDEAGVDFFSQGKVIYKNHYSTNINQEYQRKLARIMSSKRTGFIGVNDVRAIAVYQAAASNNMTMGKDVAMVGFLDLPQFHGNIFPALSSVSFDETAAGRQISELILNHACNERITIAPELIVRGSSCTDAQGQDCSLNHFYNQ